MLPLVSVLTPTYGRPELLARAVRIFLSYTYRRKEMIILDDSPKPATLPSSPLVSYVRLKDRMVLGDKHNAVAALAQGDILMHQDDDDLFAPIRMSRQVEPMLLEGIPITGMRMQFIRDETNGRFYRWADGAVFVQANPTTKPAFTFHDSTGAFQRKVWDAGLQYSRTAVAQKVHLLNDALRAGFRWKTVENNGVFVYSRHDVNTWRFARTLLAEVAAPSYTRESWFRKLMGVAA